MARRGARRRSSGVGGCEGLRLRTWACAPFDLNVLSWILAPQVEYAWRIFELGGFEYSRLLLQRVDRISPILGSSNQPIFDSNRPQPFDLNAPRSLNTIQSAHVTIKLST